ncbi:MAG: acyl carrier protein [Xanthobacteraceae bacterium]
MAIEQDRELVIDPQFFLELPSFNPRISRVEILVKRGQAHNEMTRYRYDVVLHVSEANSAPSRRGAEWHAGDDTVAGLLSRFEMQQLASVNILNVPNRRLASDLAGVQRLWSADDRQLVGDIRRSMAPEPAPGIDPEDFWKLADTQTHDVRVGWPPYSADGRFDVALVARARSPGAPLLQRPANVSPASRRGRLATDPLAVAFMQQLGLELGQILSDRLPESRLPAAVLAVNELPFGAAATLPSSATRFGQAQMRNYVTQRLRMHGDLAPLNDKDLLFTSGRLDSLDAVEIIMSVEADYGIDFSAINFDLTPLDSIAAMVDLVDQHAVSA